MGKLVDPDEVTRAARAVAREWPTPKLSMALRALSSAAAGESLDAIAAEFNVSRETVRRARNELVHEIGAMGRPELIAGLPEVSIPTIRDPATYRALRRLLTMTGPLAWDEVLAGWARAGGKAPYIQLPTEESVMRSWAAHIDGLVVAKGNNPTVGVLQREELDSVSDFFLAALGNESRGLERTELLVSAERAGLKPSTIATALSTHPSIVRLGRGVWALRGHVGTITPVEAITPRRTNRPRPTTFSWSATGNLELTFSVPRGPSPVLAMPRAISTLVEGREFAFPNDQRDARLVIKGGKLWGFAPLVQRAGLAPGSRAVLALNLIAGTAILAAEAKGATQ